MRSQIFRQIVQIERRRAGARQAKFVQDGGKDASKRAAKALPLIVWCCLNVLNGQYRISVLSVLCFAKNIIITKISVKIL